MKTKYLLYMLLAGWICAACNKEDDIVPRTSDVKLRYEFPQGDNERDRIAEDIYKQHGIYVIYKDIDSMDFRHSWTTTSNLRYTARDISEAQADFQVQFMQQHIFAYVPADISRQILPLYYYLLSDFQNSGSPLVNYVDGLDFWVSSIFTATNSALPDADKQKEHRIRILKYILETGVIRQRIVIPKAFSEGFDFTKPLNYYVPSDPNYPKKRGFPGNAVGDVYKFTSLSAMPTPEDTFKNYLFLCIRYTEAEAEVEFPSAECPLIAKKRSWMLNYIKEKYGFDLAAINTGPEL